MLEPVQDSRPGPDQTVFYSRLARSAWRGPPPLTRRQICNFCLTPRSRLTLLTGLFAVTASHARASHHPGNCKLMLRHKRNLHHAETLPGGPSSCYQTFKLLACWHQHSKHFCSSTAGLGLNWGQSVQTAAGWARVTRNTFNINTTKLTGASLSETGEKESVVCWTLEHNG